MASYVAAHASSSAQRLGLIATRTKIMQNKDSGLTWIMSRGFHIAQGRITPATLMQVIWANYIAQPNSSGETDLGTATLKASIEYNGVITPLTFGGNAVGNSAGIAHDFISDAISVTIPRGARFYVRSLYVNSANILYEQGSFDSANEHCVFGTGTPQDFVNSGTVPNPNPGFLMPPLAIIGKTSRPGILLIGDSRVKGPLDVVTDTTGDIGELARSIGPYYAYTCLAVGASTQAQALTNFANRMRMVQYATHAINQYGINDGPYGTGAASTAENRRLMAVMLGIPTVGCTIPNKTSLSNTSGTQWTDEVNQTLNGYDVTPYNQLLLSGASGGPGGEYIVVDMAKVVQPRNVWDTKSVLGAAIGSTVGSTVGLSLASDGLHETHYGNERIRDSKVIDPALFLL